MEGWSHFFSPRNMIYLFQKGEQWTKHSFSVTLYLGWGASQCWGAKGSSWREQRGDLQYDTFLCCQGRLADCINPDQKHWLFPLLPLQPFLDCMVSLHQAEKKGGVLLPQRMGSTKSIPLLLEAEGRHVQPHFLLFSWQLLESSHAFSFKTSRTFAYQRKNCKGFAMNSWSVCFHSFHSSTRCYHLTRKQQRASKLILFAPAVQAHD